MRIIQIRLLTDRSNFPSPACELPLGLMTLGQHRSSLNDVIDNGLGRVRLSKNSVDLGLN